ncbi:MAG: pterin-4-alpha-carbinolamine dehydratase [Flavobacteriales bacterium]|nr:pterin-4-alpha-carbinolamine dehydratase [Flavobacteriales bacterium]|tara:strand:- start:7287 stop:7526 length:240 start_codon:yes stop_codon:yes gene_type:complete
MVEHWTQEKGFLSRTFEFEDFQEAFTFMTRVAFLAEQLNHHPNWKNAYNVVSIHLTTHDEGNQVTHKDYELANAINQIV